MILPNLVKDVNYGNSKVAEKFSKELQSEAEAVQSKVNDFLQTYKSITGKSPSNTDDLSNLIENFNKKQAAKIKSTDLLGMKNTKLVTGLSLDFGYSKNLVTMREIESKLLSAPRGSMESIVDVAEKLGLLIIPTQYVNKRMVEDDRAEYDGYEHSVKDAYNHFVRYSERNNMNAWLVCPIQYYDIERHAKDLSYEFFVPSSVRQAFTSIKIILPMLIGMINQIEMLEKKVDNINTELQNIRNTLVAQQKQIEQLQHELTIVREERAREAAKVMQLEAELAARPTMDWGVFDPMLIAIPDHVTNLSQYKGNAVLGPAWGPEIDDLLIQLLGLKKEAERKDYLTKEYKRYY